MPLERWIQMLRLRLRSRFHGRQLDDDLSDELQYHVERLADANATSGMSPDEARRAACRIRPRARIRNP
jgi:hypothetical protein